MIRLIQWLIFGHVHEWEVIQRVKYELTWGEASYKNGTTYHCRCKKCGDMKFYRSV